MINNEFLFGGGSGEPTKTNREKINRIAKRNECEFHEIENNQHCEHWFGTRNYGESTNSQTAKELYADLGKAGLLDERGRIKTMKIRKRNTK